jgi:hypothetical protein
VSMRVPGLAASDHLPGPPGATPGGRHKNSKSHRSQVNHFQASIRDQFGNVYEFVAVKTSWLYRFQQLSTTSD